MQASLLNQLLEFYYNYDKFHDYHLTPERVREIYQVELDKDRIHTCFDESGKLLGYCESWRITYEQFGRLLCCHELWMNIEKEDIEHGNIAYVMDVTIHPDYRGNASVKKELTSQFIAKNQDAEYFVGEAKRKKTGLVKVFTRKEILRHVR